MSLFPSLALPLALALLASHASAQSDASSKLRPITSPVKNAGVLHLGTGTWTRPTSGQAFLSGLDILYANTCASIYYSGQGQGERYTDEGAIPDQGQVSTASTLIPGGVDTSPGTQASYLINGFEIAYCTYSSAFAVEIGFYDNYEPVGVTCTIPGVPSASFQITGLPASVAVNVQTCWEIGIDLDASSAEFLLTGTGSNDKLFGWSFLHSSPNMGTGLNEDGLVVAGHPGQCTGTDATRWDTGTASAAYPNNYNQVGSFPSAAEEGTGMLLLDAFRTDNGPGISAGCYWFQSPTSGIFASFHLELYGDASSKNCICSTMCFPTIDAIACPCGNNPASPDRGCNNSFNTGGAKLTLTGTNSLSNDTVVITATDERPNVTSLFLQGNNVLASGVFFGDGVRCAAGQLLRLNSPGGTAADGAGTVVYPNATFPQSVSSRSAFLGQPISAGQTRWYQTYYRDPDLGFCPAPPGNSWNVTHGVALVWNP